MKKQENKRIIRECMLNKHCASVTRKAFSANRIITFYTIKVFRLLEIYVEPSSFYLFLCFFFFYTFVKTEILVFSRFVFRHSIFFLCRVFFFGFGFYIYFYCNVHVTTQQNRTNDTWNAYLLADSLKRTNRLYSMNIKLMN